MAVISKFETPGSMKVVNIDTDSEAQWMSPQRWYM